MSNGSEKVNKNTNIVTWFLTLFTLLVSVLILIIVTGHLELLESLEALLIDKPIITLLASMSLLSFLLQIYMYANPERIAEPWKKVIARFLLRPVLLVGSVTQKLNQFEG